MKKLPGIVFTLLYVTFLASVSAQEGAAPADAPALGPLSPQEMKNADMNHQQALEALPSWVPFALLGVVSTAFVVFVVICIVIFIVLVIVIIVVSTIVFCFIRRAKKVPVAPAPEASEEYLLGGEPIIGGPEKDYFQKLESFAFEQLVLDIRLALALAEMCPSNDKDDLARSLTYIYAKNGRAVELVSSLIKIEVENSEMANTLFRADSIASKVMSFYSKMIGLGYLYEVLSPVLNEFCYKSQVDAGSSKAVEVDESRFEEDSDADVDVNKWELMATTQKVISRVFKSQDGIPIPIRMICSELWNICGSKFPEHQRLSVGGFFFLRYICPAIMVPYSYKLLYAPPGKSESRYMILIAKVVQNLVNNVEFGTKEAYMMKMNDFIKSNIPKVNDFIDSCADISNMEKIGEERVDLPKNIRDVSLANIHLLLYRLQDLLPTVLETKDKYGDGLVPLGGEKGFKTRLKATIFAIGNPVEVQKEKPSLYNMPLRQKISLSLNKSWYKVAGRMD